MSVSSSSMCGGDAAGMKSVVWFRRDLRVEDNPALAAAARTAGEVVPAYVWSPEEDGPYFPGRVSRWWLSQSLKHLEASLQRLGAGKLVTRRSPDAVVALLQLVRDTGATHLFFNHLYGLLAPFRLKYALCLLSYACSLDKKESSFFFFAKIPLLAKFSAADDPN
jgi:cryptochrome 1